MAQPRKIVAGPLDLVVITRARLQEVVDEAVERGRITRGDAADLVADLLERARGPVEAARRVTGLGPEFPISGYDDLTAAEVVASSTAWRAPTCARCATTRGRTRTARRSSARSSASCA